MTENLPENPAETMRRAATLMRERAQAVQHLATPWRIEHGPGDGDQWRVMYATDHPAAGLIATTPDYGTWRLPDHLASWHPAVALAVADWLDAAAWAWDERLEWDEALAVAKAYLGGTEEP